MLIEEPFTMKEEDIPTKVIEIIKASHEGSVNITGAKILVVRRPRHAQSGKL